jgi:hypothetical protein
VTYKEKLLRRIADPQNWPEFDRPDFIAELEALADKAYHLRTTEGYLAALLIYHQLCEEMAKLLLNCARFFVQLSVYPAEIEFRDRSRQMFGQVLDDLKETISFEGKDSFLDHATKLNQLRIEFVHKLTKQPSVAKMAQKMRQAEVMYHDLSQLFLHAYGGFRLSFKDLRKDSLLEDIEEMDLGGDSEE